MVLVNVPCEIEKNAYFMGFFFCLFGVCVVFCCCLFVLAVLGLNCHMQDL